MSHKTAKTSTPARKRKPGTPKGRTFMELQRHRSRKVASLATMIARDLGKLGAEVCPPGVAQVLLDSVKAMQSQLGRLPDDAHPPHVNRHAALQIGQKMRLADPKEFPRIDAEVLDVIGIQGRPPNLRYEMGVLHSRGKEPRSFGFVPRNAMVPA